MQAAQQPKVPFVHRELVHASAQTVDLDMALARLMEPYTSHTAAEPPLMHDVYLTPAAGALADGRLTGFVASVAGSAPAAPLITPSLGSGTTWLKVTMGEHRINDDELELAFKPVDKFTHSTHRVNVVSGMEYPKIVHYLVVAGNVPSAAVALAEQAASTRATLDDLVSGPLADAYTRVMTASREARMKTASEFMLAHGLKCDESTGEASVTSDFVAHSAALSDVAQSSRLGPKNVYLVYSGAADPSDSHAGVMMYRGSIAGYTLLKGAPKPVKGRASNAWSNADTAAGRPFSMLPVDTGAYLGEHTRRTPDRHKNTDVVIRNVHQRRVKWSGAVRSYNPLAEDIMHAPNDAHFIESLTALGAPPGGKVVSQLLDAVVTQLPALDTTRLSLGELVEVADKATESQLPVDTNSFVRMLASWPAAASQPLATLFAKQAGDVTPVDVSILRSIAAHRATRTAASPIATEADEYVD